jgi:hypothetical protein
MIVLKGLDANKDNTFTWSGPSGVFGFTGQRCVSPAIGRLHEAKHSRCAIEPRLGRSDLQSKRPNPALKARISIETDLDYVLLKPFGQSSLENDQYRGKAIETEASADN